MLLLHMARMNYILDFDGTLFVFYHCAYLYNYGLLYVEPTPMAWFVKYIVVAVILSTSGPRNPSRLHFLPPPCCSTPAMTTIIARSSSSRCCSVDVEPSSEPSHGSLSVSLFGMTSPLPPLLLRSGAEEVATQQPLMTARQLPAFRRRVAPTTEQAKW